MHPYRMQQLIIERRKDEVINVRQRAGIYQTIERLLRDGLISIKETLHEVGKPVRTVYELTEEGRKYLFEWLREVISTPIQEFPQFPAALSFLALLTMEDVLQLFEKRAAALTKAVNQIDSELQMVKDMVPRLFVLESELSRAVLSAELQWVQSVSEDIRGGLLVWDEEWLREIAKQNSMEEHY